MGKVNVCLKRCFCVFCILLGIMGGLLLAIAIFGHGLYQMSEQVDSMMPGIIFFYVIGGIIIVLSLLGTYARKEKKWALILFFIGMSLTCIFFVGLSVRFAIARRQGVKTLENHFKDAVPLDKASHSLQAAMDELQTELECCGLNSGYEDWGESIPQSCLCLEQYKNTSKCVNITSGYHPPANESEAMVYSAPCLPIVILFVDEVIDTVLGACVGIILFVLLGMVLSMTLLCQLRRRPSTAPVTFSVNASLPKYRELSDPTENI